MTDKNTASTPGGSGFLWTFLLIVVLSTGVGLVFWKWVKGSNHPRPKGEPMVESNSPLAMEPPPEKGSFDLSGPGFGSVIPFELTNHDGSPVTLESLKGKIWIINFVFTRCTAICPGMSAEMSRVRSDLKNEKDIYFLSFSVDPEFDKPEILREYMKSYGGADDHWYFLTGTRKVINSVALQSFKVGMDLPDPNDPTNVMHSNKFFIVDRAGVVRGRYSSSDAPHMQQLRENAKQLAAKK